MTSKDKTPLYVGFGELMLRLSPSGYLKFPQADSFLLNYTGAEGNVAVSLTCFDMKARLVTKVPDNDIGKTAERKMAMYGVDTRFMVKGGERLGLYYLERGASQRPSKIIYDRKYSAISQAEPEEYDWNAIFEDATWFHFSGITAGLSPKVAQACKDACICAKKHGVTVSCDLNYRANLWTPKEAQAVMIPMMEHVDVLIANEEDAEKVLGVSANNTDVMKAKIDRDGYLSLAEKLTAMYNFNHVAITLRESLSASRNLWSALLYSPEENAFSTTYDMQVVDRVGGGDSFAAGLIYALSSKYGISESVEFAAAASCLKHSMEYDFNLSTVNDVRALMNGNGSGRVQR